MSLKKRICAVSMAALMVCCNTNVQADTWYSIANLNIRETPDKESNAIGKYLRDEEVNVIEYNEDGWSKTDRGYVSSKYLSKTQGSYESSDKNRIVPSEVSESEYPLSYKSGKESITISREYHFRSVCYCAHVILPKEEQLNTMYAGNGWGDHETASEADSKVHSILMVNGDYRDKHYGADLGIVRNSEIINDHIFNENSWGITNEGKFVRTEGKSPSEVISEGIVNTWTFGPLLIDKEIITSDNTQKHPRTFIGQIDRTDDLNEYWIIVADGRQSGYSYGLTNLEMAKIMEEKDCDFAANLDGGGSSTMLFEGKLLNSPSDGKERNDADFLYIGGNKK